MAAWALAALLAAALVAALVFIVRSRSSETRGAFEAAIAALRSDFAALVAEKLEEKADRLSEKNARDVKPLFDALRENISELKESAERSREANARLGSELRTQIGEVGRRAQSLGRQADDFVSALRGGGKGQGNWGEGIVRNALEGAGLKSGTDFVEQEGTKSAGLPDFTVFDGLHRKILIDAKVNIDSFLSAVRASEEGRADEAERCMKEHAKSVRTQIIGLAGRNYPKRMKESDKDAEAEYSPVVIMAMPSEATYAAALSADPAIGAFANEKGIVLASPQMLFGYLTLLKLGLDRLKVDRNNQEIARRASQVLSRMDAAFAALEKVGKSLDDAQKAYHDAMRRLGGEEGGQNVLLPARELARLVNSAEKRNSQLMQA